MICVVGHAPIPLREDVGSATIAAGIFHVRIALGFVLLLLVLLPLMKSFQQTNFQQNVKTINETLN